MARDYRDLTIEALADDEAACRELVARYRTAYLAAVALLADQQRRITTQDRTIAALRDELHRYTAMQVSDTRRAA